MLERIHIENFKSLKDVTLDLQQVNLLIGPNNSGKSNLLKALEFFRKFQSIYYPALEDLKIIENSYKHEKNGFSFHLRIFNKDILKKNFINAENSTVKTESQTFIDSVKLENIGSGPGLPEHIVNYLRDIDFFFSNVTIFKPNPLKLTSPQAISNSRNIDFDAANIVSYLETLRDEYREEFSKIESDLSKCITEYKDIRFKTVDSPKDDKRTYKKWGLFSTNTNMIHWADELSEGTLYFLALLCIIHQPNPPKLLLLEEPERGIHPRRIKEVIDFIFTLAQEKGIQVIMTSHHERVLDYFEDIPEAVFVFDKDDEGATQIKNLKTDIIDPSNEENDRLGLPRIKFTESLGEHWVTGFIGGVPKPINY